MMIMFLPNLKHSEGAIFCIIKKSGGANFNRNLSIKRHSESNLHKWCIEAEKKSVEKQKSFESKNREACEMIVTSKKTRTF